MDILQKIKEIISEQTGIEEENLSENTTVEDVMADSLDKVEMIMSIEDAFDIDISDSDAESFNNIGDIVSYIENKMM